MTRSEPSLVGSHRNSSNLKQRENINIGVQGSHSYHVADQILNEPRGLTCPITI